MSLGLYTQHHLSMVLEVVKRARYAIIGSWKSLSALADAMTGSRNSFSVHAKRAAKRRLKHLELF